MSEFLLASGMSPSQLSGTAKICLSVGYRTDDMDVALGSALVLVALGEGVYGELMGHHLTQGFGTSRRPDLALAWYEMGLEAVDSGRPRGLRAGSAVAAGADPQGCLPDRRRAVRRGGRARGRDDGDPDLRARRLKPANGGHGPVRRLCRGPGGRNPPSHRGTASL